MKNKSRKETVLSGFFIALGLILPTVFHTFGGGSTFLPMHIPVLIAGFVLSLPFAIAVGAITPILSSLLTGMPPAFPVLPFMVFELAAYGAATSLLYKKFKLNVYISLICSMLVGRIISSIVVWVLATFFMAKLPSPIVFITGAIAQGIPGIIIQIVFIPAIVFALEKSNLIKREGIIV
ncbi:ECF transporter S component [Geosporobacter ferrireducens]|uniref:ECF transporter S component n=1 Tax=Geosporobacter ferrireducens TaxID=1424294 RepID=A0A1D8GHH9_9FIRM|nr:ECF transporter S component [Geosporobacter ferrireducens]AOT70344.1 ECF transporter S component [Geosporobacter ferrireducens]